MARADGGTLVLDHVEELPLPAQPKLLRLVAERRYAPLAGPEMAADVRFVAIGSEDLHRRVAREAFRADLFYRLEVLAFRMPPLRDRRADLPAVLDHLLADLGERFGRPNPVLAPRALAWMLEHPWPGNLRQLRNTLERGLILAAGELVDPPPPEGFLETRPRPLVEVEKEQIRNALAYTRGNQSPRRRAARHQPQGAVGEAPAVRDSVGLPPARALTPGPSPAPSLPPSPGEGNEPEPVKTVGVLCASERTLAARTSAPYRGCFLAFSLLSR